MTSNFAIKHEKNQDGYRLVFIDTSKADYQGIAWATLGDYGKRKFENLLFLTRTKEHLKVIYV